jgi:ParB family chromosome partitioning protein
MMTDYTQPEHWHDAAKLFPILPIDELTSLAADIKAHGLQNPIVLLDGKLLDGRNRAIACKQVGIQVQTVNWKPNGISPLQWVMSQNHHRRHLTASQLAVIALEAEAEFAKEPKGRKSLGPAAKRAGQVTGVSHGYVVQAKRIATKSPELLNDIKNGKLTIPEAQKKLGFKQAVAATVSSEMNEWYTPKKYVDAARQVFGEIDLDPASCVIANKVIKAKRYFTQEEDGLKQEWSGRVWLNPPYGNVGPEFIAKLINSYESGKVSDAILLINSHCTDAKWFQPLFDYVICFTDHRPKFWNARKDKSSPTHGSVFVYFGKNPKTFESNFRQFGSILCRYTP